MCIDKKGILIVDDEKRMVRGLRDFFLSKGYCVYGAYNGEDALEVYLQNYKEIDVIVLDIMMPVMDGITMLRELRAMESDVPVIMLSAKGEEYDQMKGFQTGVDDYVVKPCSPSLLLARVEAILRRVKKMYQTNICCGELEIDMQRYVLLVNHNEVEMTRREIQLLHFLVINQGIVLSREQILDQVWGYDYDGDARTIDTHIKQLRIKLQSCSKYIKTVRMVGYVFEVAE